MAIPSSTFLEICQELADRLQAREYGTLTASAAATVTCANYPFMTNESNVSAKKYEGCELYITSRVINTAAPNPLGITTYAPSTGVFTVSQSYTREPDETATFEIYKKGITIAMLKRAVNRALTNLMWQSYAPLSILPDADMEYADASLWGTPVNCAASKEPLVTGDFMYGTRVMRVLNSDVNGYLPSSVIDVEPNASYYVQAEIKVDSGTAVLELYDYTNSVVLESEDCDDYQWTRLYFSEAIPSSCKQVQVRLKGSEATADVNWDNVMFFKTGANQIELPDYIVYPQQLKRPLYASAQLYGDRDKLFEYRNWSVKPDMMGVVQRYFLITPGGLQAPTWLDVVRPYSELSADSDTTHCDFELLVVQAENYLLDDLINKAPGQEVAAWKAERSTVRKALVRQAFKQNFRVPVKMGFDTPF